MSSGTMEIEKKSGKKLIDEMALAYQKQIPIKPDILGDGYDEDGEMIYDMWNCPNCDITYELECDKFKYCPNCGQRIDWSEYDAEEGNKHE